MRSISSNHEREASEVRQEFRSGAWQPKSLQSEIGSTGTTKRSRLFHQNVKHERNQKTPLINFAKNARRRRRRRVYGGEKEGFIYTPVAGLVSSNGAATSRPRIPAQLLFFCSPSLFSFFFK